MAKSSKPTYKGPLKGVIFDWAGTTVDFGCCAPAGVFVEAFQQNGVEITLDQARGPMGTHKRMHIKLLLETMDIRREWVAAHGKEPTEADIDRIYEDFVPKQIEIVTTGDYDKLIPGVPELATTLRERGLKIGSCTGYTREMMDRLIPSAKKQGYAPDCVVCSSEVPEGRPSPLMVYKNMVELGIWPPEAVVKVGDTVPDIQEGMNAGTWIVGVAATGNEVGMPLAEYEETDEDSRKLMVEHAAAKLRDAGAHYVIDSVDDLPEVLDQIETRLTLGETPG